MWGQKSIKKRLDEMKCSLSTDLKSSFEGMKDFASENLQALSSLVVLPSAESYFFKNAGIDAEGNVYFDTSVNS